MKTPEPVRRALTSPRGLIVAAVVVAATLAQIFDLGWWGVGLIVLAGWAALTLELWIDAGRKEGELANLRDELRDARGELESASESFEITAMEAAAVPGLREEVRQLRSEASAGTLTLQRLLGELANQKTLIETIQRQRLLRDAANDELLVVRITLTGDSALVSAHTPLGASEWDSELVTLINGHNAIQGNGLVVGTTDNQVAAQFGIDALAETFRDELQGAGAVDPDGFRLVPWGLTLNPYLTLDDDDLEEVRFALADCADAIAIAFVHPQTPPELGWTQLDEGENESGDENESQDEEE